MSVSVDVAAVEVEALALRRGGGGEVLVLQESSEDRLSVHSAAASGMSGGQAAEARTVTTVATAGSDLGIEGASTVAAFSDQEDADAERADRPATGSRPPSSMALPIALAGAGTEDTSSSSDDDSSDSSARFPRRGREPAVPPSMGVGAGNGAVVVTAPNILHERASSHTNAHPHPHPHRSNSISPAISSVLNEMVAEVAQQLRQQEQPNPSSSRGAAHVNEELDLNAHSSALVPPSHRAVFDLVSAYELDDASDEFHSPAAQNSSRSQPPSIDDGFGVGVGVNDRRPPHERDIVGGSVAGSFSLAMSRPAASQSGAMAVAVERQLSSGSAGPLGALVWSSDEEVAGVGDGGEASEDEDALSFNEVPGDAEREPDEDDEDDEEEMERVGEMDDEMAESNSETASGEIEEVEDELLTAGSGGSDPEAAAEGDRETTDDDLLERAPRSARRGRRVNWLPAFPTRRGLSRGPTATHSRARGRQHSFASSSRASGSSAPAQLEPPAVPLQLAFSVAAASGVSASSLMPGAYGSLDRTGTGSSSLQTSSALELPASSHASGRALSGVGVASISSEQHPEQQASASTISTDPRYFASVSFAPPPPPPHPHPHPHPWHSLSHSNPSAVASADGAHPAPALPPFEPAAVEREAEQSAFAFSWMARSPAARAGSSVLPAPALGNPSGRYTFSNVASTALRGGVHQAPSASGSSAAPGATGEHTVRTQVVLARAFRILVKTAADLHFLLNSKSLGKVLTRKRYLSASAAQLEQLLVSAF